MTCSCFLSSQFALVSFSVPVDLKIAENCYLQIIKYLPAFEGCGKVMFLQVSVCLLTEEGGTSYPGLAWVGSVRKWGRDGRVGYPRHVTRYPHAWTGSGVPLHLPRQDQGYPSHSSQTGQGVHLPFPRQNQGYPSPSHIGPGCITPGLVQALIRYAAGGMPLAFTQEDFLVGVIFRLINCLISPFATIRLYN